VQGWLAGRPPAVSSTRSTSRTSARRRRPSAANENVLDVEVDAERERDRAPRRDSLHASLSTFASSDVSAPIGRHYRHRVATSAAGAPQHMSRRRARAALISEAATARRCAIRVGRGGTDAGERGKHSAVAIVAHDDVSASPGRYRVRYTSAGKSACSRMPFGVR
jgi:hypothetical protein